MVRARYSARCSMERGLIGPHNQRYWPSPGTQVWQWRQTSSSSHWHSSNLFGAAPQAGTNSKQIVKACGLGDNRRSHVKRLTQVRTTLLDGYSSCDRWKILTSSSAFSSFFFSISEIGGFEGVATSFAMTKFSPASTKTKRVVETMWYLRSKWVEVFLFNKLG